MVHKGNKGIVVISILAEIYSQDIRPHFFDKIPSIGKKIEAYVDPSILLPKKRSHFFYRGSLTTPPCTEGIQWIVLNTPVKVSQKQLRKFKFHYPDNHREIQNTNKRTIFFDTGKN